MEVLTTMGWSSAYSIEAVIPQIMASMGEGGARIPMEKWRDYNETTARNTFNRLQKHHEKAGWGAHGRG